MGKMMARRANRIVRSIVAAYAFVSLPMVAALITLVAMTAAFSGKADAICLNPGCSICKDVCNSARQNYSEVMREIKIKGKDHYDASADLSKFYEERAPECTKRTFDQQLDLQRLLVGAMQPSKMVLSPGSLMFDMMKKVYAMENSKDWQFSDTKQMGFGLLHKWCPLAQDLPIKICDSPTVKEVEEFHHQCVDNCESYCQKPQV